MIHLVEPAPMPVSEPDDLPDYVVLPGSDRPGARADEPLSNSTGLGFPPITELILARDGEPPLAQENEKKAPPDRTPQERRTGKERRGRSSYEPGDENDETGWMQGLSNRLSAYSLSEDDSSPEPDEEESSES